MAIDLNKLQQTYESYKGQTQMVSVPIGVKKDGTPIMGVVPASSLPEYQKMAQQEASIQQSAKAKTEQEKKDLILNRPLWMKAVDRLLPDEQFRTKETQTLIDSRHGKSISKEALKQVGKGALELSPLYGAIKLGQQVGGSLAQDYIIQPQIQKNVEQISKSSQRVMEAYKKETDPAKKERLKAMIQENIKFTANMLAENEKDLAQYSPAKILGAAGLTLLDITTLGLGGQAVKQAGKVTARETGEKLITKVGQEVLRTGKEMAPVGFGYGTLGSVAEGETRPGEILKSGAIGAGGAVALGLGAKAAPAIFKGALDMFRTKDKKALTTIDNKSIIRPEDMGDVRRMEARVRQSLGKSVSPEETSSIVKSMLKTNDAEAASRIIDDVRRYKTEAPEFFSIKDDYKLPSEIHQESYKRYIKGIKDTNAIKIIEELHDKASKDRLTKILGNNFYHEYKAKLNKQPQAFGDLNDFGNFNRAYSDAVGDEVLSITSGIASKKGVEIIRKGGEEFIVYSRLPKNELAAKLKEINQEIKNTDFYDANGNKIELPDFTWGIGKDMISAEEAMRIQKAIKKGDVAFARKVSNENINIARQKDQQVRGTKLGDKGEKAVQQPRGSQAVRQGTRKKPDKKAVAEKLGEKKVKKVEFKADNQFKSKVYDRMKNELPESMRENVEYTRINLEKDIDNAIKTINKDKNSAYDIAMGRTNPPDGQTSASINIVMAEKALEEGNYKLYSDLTRNRSLAQTRRGQEIVAEKGSITDNSLSKYVKEYVDLKLNALGKLSISEKAKKTSLKQKAVDKIDNEVVNMEKKISSKKLKMNEALKLLDQLKCIS